MKLIGLSGYKRSGKDTFFNYVKNHINQDAIAFSFAKPVKDICEILFSLDNEQLYGNDKEIIDERYNLTPRQIMQKLGTDLFRNKFSEVFTSLNYGNEIWLKVLENKIKKYEKTDTVVFITDCRFKNEVDLIKKYNGTTINIIRKGLKHNDKHQSEVDLNNTKFDYIVENDTLDNYYKKIKNIYNKLII